VKTARLALLATAIAIATAPGARAHDGAGPHSHGSADPRPLAAAPPAESRSAEEIATLLDRVGEERARERDERAAQAPAKPR